MIPENFQKTDCLTSKLEEEWFLCIAAKILKYYLLLTPFRSFRPLAGRMLTYFEAMSNPREHTVKTFAIGRTANIMLSNRDFPPPWVARIVDNKFLSILLVLPRKGTLSEKRYKILCGNRNLSGYQLAHTYSEEPETSVK